LKRSDLIAQIKKKESFLCVGLDTDINKIPKHLLDMEDPIFEFNKAIIDATKNFAVAYKPNLAFYEAHGVKGWQSLQKTLEYIPNDIFTIADAKRGDIGNTSGLYARAFFEEMSFDSVTVAPYMGNDSVTPFYKYEDKWVILLALTSNPGAMDFQFERIDSQQHYLFEKVLEKSKEWGNEDNMMYVVGATQANMLEKIRNIVPNSFLLIPGVGAQGGSLEDVCKYGMTEDCALLVNSSRGVIYAGEGVDFAEKASEQARLLQEDMAVHVNARMK
jgi:orotidine-5'-phosphate decarboxylase